MISLLPLSLSAGGGGGELIKASAALYDVIVASRYVRATGFRAAAADCPNDCAAKLSHWAASKRRTSQSADERKKVALEWRQ